MSICNTPEIKSPHFWQTYTAVELEYIAKHKGVSLRTEVIFHKS